MSKWATSSMRLMAITGVIVLGTIAAWKSSKNFVINGGKGDIRWDPERADNGAVVVAQAIEDHYWWKGELPRSVMEVAILTPAAPAQWQPIPGSKIEWLIKPNLISDTFHGGELYEMFITTQYGNHRLETRHTIDLRDPLKIWKPHYTMIYGFPVKYALRPRHIASLLAMWAQNAAGSGRSEYTPSRNDLEEANLPSMIMNDWSVRKTGAKIVVTNISSGSKYIFPDTNPESVNRTVAQPSLKSVAAASRLPMTGTDLGPVAWTWPEN